MSFGEMFGPVNWVWGLFASASLAVVISADAAVGPATAMETNAGFDQ
jgi:hypothetical protein